VPIRENSNRLTAGTFVPPVARRQKITRVPEGAVLANLFFEARTRTRLSFSSAFARLGRSACGATGFTFSSMAKGGSLHDTSRVISGLYRNLTVTLVSPLSLMLPEGQIEHLARGGHQEPRLALFKQTDNGIAVSMAIFATLLGVQDQIPHSLREVAWRVPVYLGPDEEVPYRDQ